MNEQALIRQSLIEFIEECAANIESGNVVGVATLWAKMAPEAESMDIILPLQGSIALAAQSGKAFDAHGWAMYLRGFAETL